MSTRTSRARRKTPDERQLVLSVVERPAIQLDAVVRRVQGQELEARFVKVLWFRVAAEKFSGVVDGIAVLCAVLLFSLVTVAVTGVFPSWLFLIAFLAGVSMALAGLYWLVFAVWFKATPGVRLARLAGAHSRRNELRKLR